MTHLLLAVVFLLLGILAVWTDKWWWSGVLLFLVFAFVIGWRRQDEDDGEP